MLHANAVEIVDESGKAVPHTREMIRKVFDEELERLVREPGKDSGSEATMREALRMSEEMIERGEFDPV
jgi:hypothetical protein